MTSYSDYVGKTERRTDTVWPLLVQGLAATLDLPLPVDGILPPLWHWTLFQEWAPGQGLGPDGHPKRGGFLPPVHDLPRRMWAGGRLVLHAPLQVGQTVERTSTILRIDEKIGGSGRLVFVTVRHDISGPDGLAVVEEQDIVYRGTEGAAVKAGQRAAAAPESSFSRQVEPNAVLLFRYSALTGNGHRIHYDLDYARNEEFYPGLVVHGPLQATWLADLVGRCLPGRLETFSFRGRRPAFHDRALDLEGWQDGEILRLQTRDSDGAICMTAEATVAG